MYSVLKGLDISFRDATLHTSVATSGYELVLPLVSNQPVRYDLEKVVFPLLNTHDIFSFWGPFSENHRAACDVGNFVKHSETCSPTGTDNQAHYIQSHLNPLSPSF